MKGKNLEKKSKEIRTLIKNVVQDKIRLPDRAVIFLDADALLDIITKKRLELIQLINEFKPRSVQKLADLTHRKKQAVNRDLKILERHELVELKKVGRTVQPKIEKKFLIFGLTELYSFGNISQAKGPTNP